MKKGRLPIRAGIGAIIATAAVAPAQALAQPIPIDTSWCQSPMLSQPFSDDGDSNFYAALPGQSSDSFDGTGWTLSGGANVVDTTLADGSTGSVLNLPAGSTATSPPMCVTSAYPTARAMVRSVTGKGKLAFSVGYQGRRSWATPRVAARLLGSAASWSPSALAPMFSSYARGWQVVEIVLAPGSRNAYQVYNVYVDPRMAR